MSKTCEKCNHEHQGKRLGYICIGCPCDERPGCEHVRIEDGECITCGLRAADSAQARGGKDRTNA